MSLQLAEVNICEHVENDASKFGLWQGEKVINEMRTLLKASSEKAKVAWVKRLRQLKHGLTIRAFGECIDNAIHD